MHNISSPPAIADAQTQVNRFLSDVMKNKIQSADERSTHYGDLWRSMQTLVQSGGKRLRPYMTTLMYGAYGGDTASVGCIRAATATELLHVALLIHDDIIDRDLTRRGIKNISGQYMDIYSETIADFSTRLHFANSAAILAGDLLIAEAYALIGTIEDVDQAKKRLAIAHFNEAVFAVCCGELLDTEQAFRPSNVDAIGIADLKTASYSFVGPLLVGASLMGADDAQIALLRDYGQAIGIGFQLQDDVLGIFGDAEITGKTTIGDIREGKRTYMVEQFYLRASHDDKQAFEQSFGVQDRPEEDYHEAAGLLERSGARLACEEEIERQRQRAYKALNLLAVNDAYKNALREAVDLCTIRSS